MAIVQPLGSCTLNVLTGSIEIARTKTGAVFLVSPTVVKRLTTSYGLVNSVVFERTTNVRITCVFYDCPDHVIVTTIINIIMRTMVTGTNEMRLDAIKNGHVRCCIIRQYAAVLYEIPGGRRDRSMVTCRNALCTGTVRGEM